VQDGDLDALRQWLDSGGEMTEQHEFRTPIELAAHDGKLELVKFLVERGAPVGDAFLHALDGGQGEVVRWFFAQEPARKAEPNALIFEKPGLWRNLALVRTFMQANVHHISDWSSKSPARVRVIDKTRRRTVRSRPIFPGDNSGRGCWRQQYFYSPRWLIDRHIQRAE
jgi:hypothetical protein